MTRERAKELLPVISEFSNGKEVEYQAYDGKWYHTDSPKFDCADLSYRVKQEPREFWLVSQKGSCLLYGVWINEPIHLKESHDIIHVREVGE